MNLQISDKQVAGGKLAATMVVGFFRQILPHGLFFSRLMTHTSVRVGLVALRLCLALVIICLNSASAQTNYYFTNGTEYAVVGALAGDQNFPDTAISSTGGYVVWQDNITDGDSWGISARKLDSTLSGTLGTFRVNVAAAGPQENPKVAMLKDGGAVFVWQGGKLGNQHVYARFLNSSNTFVSVTDVLVNTFTNNYQINPSVAVLNNSNVVVVWQSYSQAGSNAMLDVYGQILSPVGTKVGGEFIINQFVNYNQRSPMVAALPAGGFIVTWVSEQQRLSAPSLGTNSTFTAANSVVTPSVDIYARQFGNNATAVGSEFLVNTGLNPCSNPSIGVATDGGFMIAWAARDMSDPNNGYDIYAKSFTSSGVGGAVFYVNSRIYGDEYLPRVSGLGLDYLVAWTSLGQDGSREGVYGQFVHQGGTLVGTELKINTTTASQQLNPAIASDGAGQFLVVWTGFTGFPNQFDLCAQRYLIVGSVLQAMSAPYVWAPFVISNGNYQPRLVVSWAPLLGLSVSNYEVYVDGSTSAAGVVVSNQWVMTSSSGLTANSTHSFKIDYVTTDGRRSPLSPASTGTTWQGYNWGGIPFEWMVSMYGNDLSQWPGASSKVAGNGPTVYQIFLSGGNPLDASTWLKQVLTKSSQGMFLNWNTQPGATYQVQVTTNFNSWSNVGTPRFAAGTSDSIYVGGGSVGYYRILLLR